MERKFILNYNALNNYISEQQKDPNRTDWELTMLRDNFWKNLVDVLSNDNESIIIINETTGDICINWQNNLEDKFNMIPTWYEISKKDHLYHQVKQSIEEAKNRWIYDQIFKEIRDPE